ncbi:MAG: FHA domain-containing protein [Isosphaeraceae bacterium]
MMRTNIPGPARSDEPESLDALRRGPEEAGPTTGRRMEDWVVSMMLGRDDSGSTTNLWADLLGASAHARLWRSTPGRSRAEPGASAVHRTGWSRFRVARRHDMTVVSLTDASLIREHELFELAGDLRAMIESGHHRLILDFSAVERLSSWVVALVAEVHRRCIARRGGALRVCGLRPELAAIFRLTGLDREVRFAADQASALGCDWPALPAYRPLPIDLLRSLIREKRVCSDEASAGESDEAGRVAVCVLDHDTATSSGAGPGIALAFETRPGVWYEHAFASRCVRIGRDACCELRTRSRSVSRVHARVVWEDGSYRIEDLGSTNGSYVNGRRVRRGAMALRIGDRIRVGDLNLELCAASESERAGWTDETGLADDEIVAWLAGRDGDDLISPPTVETFAVGGDDASDESDAFEPGDHAIRIETVGDVTVVTPLRGQAGGRRGDRVAPRRTRPDRTGRRGSARGGQPGARGRDLRPRGGCDRGPVPHARPARRRAPGLPGQSARRHGARSCLPRHAGRVPRLSGRRRSCRLAGRFGRSQVVRTSACFG